MRRTNLILLSVVATLTACSQRMEVQPKYRPLGPAPALSDNQAARLPPPGAIALDETPVKAPDPLTLADLERGQERFDIYCTPCHGVLGDGHGPVVERGFPAPPDFHSERLRALEADAIYKVISEGYGVMYAYSDRVPPTDRWRIAYYVKALQLSQHADPSLLPATQPTGKSAPAEEPHS